MYREPRPPPASLHTARQPLGCSRLPRSREGFSELPVKFFFLFSYDRAILQNSKDTFFFSFFFNNDNSLKNISIQFQIIREVKPWQKHVFKRKETETEQKDESKQSPQKNQS